VQELVAMGLVGVFPALGRKLGNIDGDMAASQGDHLAGFVSK
jgi:hypothetical protein